jgi:hypothetical protein
MEEELIKNAMKNKAHPALLLILILSTQMPAPLLLNLKKHPPLYQSKSI